MKTPHPPAAARPATPAAGAGRDAALWCARGLAAAALGVSAYLLWRSLGHQSVAGCGAGSDCDYVLGSRWSHWLGIPVGGAAALAHAGILLASAAAGRGSPPGRRRLAWSAMLLLASAAAGAAAWFLYLQAAVLHALCPWCAADHALALALWGVVTWGATHGPRRPAGDAAPGRDRALAPAAAAGVVVLGLAAAAGLAASQRLSPGAFHVAILSHPLDLPRDQVPVIGPPDAPHALFLLGDYTCPHCRELHGWLARALERYGSQITLVVLPVPANSRCNRGVKVDHPMHRNACELNRLALAGWRADPAAYAAVDRLLFAQATPLEPDEARQAIAGVVGAEALRRAEADPRVDRDLARDVDLFVELGAGPVPKLLVGDAKVDGLPPSLPALFDLIEKQFHVRPVPAAAAVTVN